MVLACMTAMRMKRRKHVTPVCNVAINNVIFKYDCGVVLKSSRIPMLLFDSGKALVVLVGLSFLKPKIFVPITVIFVLVVIIRIAYEHFSRKNTSGDTSNQSTEDINGTK